MQKIHLALLLHWILHSGIASLGRMALAFDLGAVWFGLIQLPQKQKKLAKSLAIAFGGLPLDTFIGFC